MFVLQNCMDLEKHVSAPCSETYPTSSHDANQAMNIKVEEVSDIEVEEEHPMPMSFIGIKAEHEVSCMSPLCPLFGRFHTRQELPVVSHISICLSVYPYKQICCGEWILKSPFQYVSAGLFSLHIACRVPVPLCLQEIYMK
jgi:hypothetical protein